MDALDVRILRAMGIRPFGRARGADAIRAPRLARAVGVTVDTVKERVARMERAGVVAGYQVIPNLRHLGLTGEAYLVRAADDAQKEAIVAEACAIPRILEVHDFLGEPVCVDFAFGDAREREAALARFEAITGRAPLRFYGRGMPEVPRALTPLDWRILRALRADARRSPAEVAQDVGVSGRTVKRRLERMADEGSFFVLPVLDMSKADGLILFTLLVHLGRDAGPDTLRALLRELDESTLYAYVPSSEEIGNFDMVLMAFTPAGIDGLRRRAMAVPGVERAEPWLLRGFLYRGEWVEGELDRLSKTATAARESIESPRAVARRG
ncbi:MAG TPA: AsnC family transcriptional regulator [Candidatus Thermoplasmatota archaeon]|nr:AsnC family transcriptional regulator [Candidatus Thermoplasmatota archaeon]